MSDMAYLSPSDDIAGMPANGPQPGVRVYHDDCRNVLPQLPSESVDFVFTDPPYPEMNRKYGKISVKEWHELLAEVMTEVRRVLRPTGSAVLVLQPNSERVGKLRPWLWEFLAHWTSEWNMIQDMWWWNFATPPSVHSRRTVGLLRPSVKLCAWFGSPACYRNQDAVLWEESDRNKAMRAAQRAGKDWTGQRPHDQHARFRASSTAESAAERGGVTPFNCLPLAHTASRKPGVGHEGQTPEQLTRWWLSYACPQGGTVLDPFCGTGTTLRVAVELGLHAIGVEQNTEWYEIATQTGQE